MNLIKFVIPSKVNLIPYFERLITDHIRLHGPNIIECIKCFDSFESNSIYVFLEPNEKHYEDYIRSINSLKNIKIIVYGSINPSLFKFLDSHKIDGNTSSQTQSSVSFCEDNNETDYISTTNYFKTIFPHSPLSDHRVSSNYDFDKEWNNRRHANLDYSDIAKTYNKSIDNMSSSICTIYRNSHQQKSLINYFQFHESNLLLINRRRGLSDLPETYILEEYLSNCTFGRHTCYPIVPIISESSIKDGDKLISMRLDCDEDIDSALPVYQLYNSLGLPVSLAITSFLLEDIKTRPTLPSLVIDSGGSLLSHSHSHPVAWGGSYAESLKELTYSRELIKRNYEYTVEYAISPFHDMPHYLVPALEKCQYKGIVGGISSKYTDYLTLTSGQISYKSDVTFINQQCMLHGQTHQMTSDSWQISLSYFLESSIRIGKSSGYLDHPISERYCYGWINSNNQVDFHSKFVNILLANNIKFISQNDLFERIRAKQNISFKVSDKSSMCIARSDDLFDFSLYIRYGGNEYELKAGQSHEYSLIDNSFSLLNDNS